MAIDNDPVDPILSKAIAGLTDNEPERDLWPGITERIASDRIGTIRLKWPVAIAAALTLVASGSIVTTQLMRQDRTVDLRTNPDNSMTGSLVLPAGFREATVSLNQAIAQLEVALAREAPSLEPRTRAVIEESLGSLDRAIEDARNQVIADPGNLNSAKYLTTTLQRKLSTLQSVTSLPMAS